MTLEMSTSTSTTYLGASPPRRPSVAAAPVLVMEGVCKSYAAGAQGCRAVVRVLDGASLRVGVGEIVGVAGGEGAGKSTLLLCAAGVVRAERGRVRWGAEEGECRGSSFYRPRYFDLGGSTAWRDVRSAIASGAPLVLLDHASAALLAELRGVLAQSRPGGANAGAIVVTSRSRAALARVVSRVLVLRDGRLPDGAPCARTGPYASVAVPTQRKRCAARASSEFPAAFARARMRST